MAFPLVVVGSVDIVDCRGVHIVFLLGDVVGDRMLSVRIVLWGEGGQRHISDAEECGIPYLGSHERGFLL